jgi:hypothetical protein
MRSTSIMALAWTLTAACGDTGQKEISLSVFASGQAPRELEIQGWRVTLESAEVGLGPIYFCATASVDPDLCETAVAELASAAAIDALDPTPQAMGTLRGFSGEIRTATYDYAVPWLMTRREPTPTPAAPGGHSARFEGRAVKGGAVLRFRAEVDVVATRPGSQAIHGDPQAVRLTGAERQLDIHLDPHAWWEGVDFDELAAQGGDPVVVAPGSRAYNAIVLGMSASHRPRFTWSAP